MKKTMILMTLLLAGLVQAASVGEIEREIRVSDNAINAAQAALKDRCSLADYSPLVEKRGDEEIWTKALQKALDEHEIVVLPRRDEFYFIDAPVVVPSNRRIEAKGAKVKLAKGVVTVMLRTASAADGTLKPVAAQRVPRVSNICILGGAWYDNSEHRRGYGLSGKFNLEHRRHGNFFGVSTLFYFGNADKVKLADWIEFHDCGGFAVQCGDGDGFLFEGVKFVNCFADGLHLNGNLTRVHANHVKGRVGDDLVALNAYDWLDSSVNFGPQRWILSENLHLETRVGDAKAYPAIRIQPACYRFADGSVVDCAINDVVFRHVRGIGNFKMYLQTPRYEIGTEPEWGRVGSGGGLHFEDVVIDLDRPIDKIGTYATSDPVRGHYAAFEFGANLTDVSFKDVDITFHLDDYPLGHLATIGPKSCYFPAKDGKPAMEIFDPYVSCHVGKVTVENLTVRGRAPEELVKTVEFNDLNGDGRSTGRGEVDEFVYRSDFRLGAPFSDGMVLQRGMKVPVWGRAAIGSEVTVEFAGQTLKTKADRVGCWKVELEPLEASSVPREMVVTSHPSPLTSHLSITNILVGEVWMASGQSNMEMAFASNSPYYGDDIGAMIAQVTDEPEIRYLTAPGGWSKLDGEFLRAKRRAALAVHYALELHAKLKIPVGIVVGAVGGSNIDNWNPAFGRIAWHHERFFRPLEPFAMRGGIWYQGETNVREVGEYPGKLADLHDGWRKLSGNDDLEFYLVQLAPFRYDSPEARAALPAFMEAQARFARETPNAAVAVASDLGCMEDVHPGGKWLIAKRLALHAFKRCYGYSDIEDESPYPVSARADGSRVTLKFAHAKTMYFHRRTNRWSKDFGFELCGADGVWKKAEVKNFPASNNWTTYTNLAGDEIVLEAKDMAKPVKVRYAYAEPWEGFLFNEVNLPAGPFEITVTAPPRPFASGERVTFFGDSITHGGLYHSDLQLFWDTRFPGSGTRMMNCGRGGGSAGGALVRWDYDALGQRPDRIFAMFGMNDVGRDIYSERWPSDPSEASNRVHCIELYRTNMTEIVRRAAAAGKPLVLMTPTPYDQYGSGYKAKNFRGCNDPGLSTCAEIVRSLAAANGLPLVELHRPLTARLQEWNRTGFLFNRSGDRVHPEPVGHLIIACEILKELGVKAEFDGLALDAAGKTVLETVYAPKALPYPVTDVYREADRVYPVTDAINREILRVANLPTGDYELTADGKRIGTATAAELAKGVNLALLETPNQQVAREAAKVSDGLSSVQRKRRTIVFVEYDAYRKGARRDDFEDICAKVEDYVEHCRKHGYSWGEYYASQLKEYRNLKSQEAKLEKEEDATRAKLAAFRPVSYRLGVRRVDPASEPSPLRRIQLENWARFSADHRETLQKGDFLPLTPDNGRPLVGAETAAERIWGVYSTNAVCRVGAMDRPIWLLNGTGTEYLTAEFSECPACVSVRDIYGGVIARPRLSAGVVRIAVPAGGSVELAAKYPVGSAVSGRVSYRCGWLPFVPVEIAVGNADGWEIRVEPADCGPDAWKQGVRISGTAKTARPLPEVTVNWQIERKLLAEAEPVSGLGSRPLGAYAAGNGRNVFAWGAGTELRDVAVSGRMRDRGEKFEGVAGFVGPRADAKYREFVHEVRLDTRRVPSAEAVRALREWLGIVGNAGVRYHDYDGTLIDNCWMWGHDSGVYDGPDRPYGIPVSEPVSMAEALRYMGIPNVCVIRWGDPPKPFEPNPPNQEYLAQFRDVKRFTWAIANNRDSVYPRMHRFVPGLLDRCPNMIGFDLDDFFRAHLQPEGVTIDGKVRAVQPGALTCEELRSLKAEMNAYERPLDLRMTIYVKDLKPELAPLAALADSVALWTWSGGELTEMEANFRKYREILPDKPTLLGIYMWDFGGRIPMTAAQMEYQLSKALELFRTGQIDGLVFHCTPLVNKNLEAVDYCRDWLRRFGSVRAQAERR